MLRKMLIMAKEKLGLEDWFLLLGPYPLQDEVGMGVVCVTLSSYLRKGRYVGNIQW